MITRNTKSEPTIRQRQEAAADDTPEWMRKPKYLRFRFSPEWLEYIDTLPKEDGDNLLLQIRAYALYDAEPEELTPEAQEYFNREIRPELDRQHKRLNEGKRI